MCNIIIIVVYINDFKKKKKTFIIKYYNIILPTNYDYGYGADVNECRRVNKIGTNTATLLSIIRSVVANYQNLTVLIVCFLEHLFTIFQFIFNQVLLVFLYSRFRAIIIYYVYL